MKTGPVRDPSKPYSRHGGELTHHGKRPACLNGHPWVKGSYKIRSDGKRICLIRIEEKRPTHCPAGHDYLVYAYIKSDGALNCKECIRLRMPIQRPKRYGMALDQVHQALEEQDYKCAICQREFTDDGYTRYSIDHNHACCPELPACGKCFRGLLCKYCNSALGYLNDDPAILRAALEYIERLAYRPPLPR